MAFRVETGEKQLQWLRPLCAGNEVYNGPEEARRIGRGAGEKQPGTGPWSPFLSGKTAAPGAQYVDGLQAGQQGRQGTKYAALDSETYTMALIIHRRL